MMLSPMPTSTFISIAVLLNRAKVLQLPSRGKFPIRILDKGVDLTGLLGRTKEDWRTEVPQRGPGQSLGRGLGYEVPPKLKLFFVKLHIFIKIQQTTVVAVIHLPWVSGHSFLCSLKSTS